MLTPPAGAVIEFSLAAIHEFTVAEVAPAADANVTEQEVGGAIADPVGVAGLGISPSPSAGAVPDGSTGNEAADTGGAGWVIGPAALTGANAKPEAKHAVLIAAMIVRRRAVRMTRPRDQEKDGSIAAWAASSSSHIATVWSVVRVAEVFGSSSAAWYTWSRLPVRAAATVSSTTLRNVRFRAASCTGRSPTERGAGPPGPSAHGTSTQASA